MPFSGSCDCGAVTYTIEAPALYVYACHCLNCQTRSGSAFAEHTMVETSAFASEGDLAMYRREAHGVCFEEFVCGNCHTRLFNRNSGLPGTIFLRAGTLADSQRVAPMAHIWVRRKQPWVLIADHIPTFPESPTPEQFEGVITLADAREEDNTSKV